MEKINKNPSDAIYTIELTDNIDFGEAGYECKFTKDTVILGESYTVDVGTGNISVSNGATLSLGKEDGSDKENKLIITTSSSKRSIPLIKVGEYLGDSGCTLNMYDGVELTGCNYEVLEHSESAIIHCDGKFNMSGGSIRDNKIVVHDSSSFAAPVVIETGEGFNMEGGSITGNIIGTKNSIDDDIDHIYGGGGVMISSTNDAIFSGGEISNNKTFGKGGGILLFGNSTVEIKKDFRITGNSALYGGGVCGVDSLVNVEEGAIIANNKAEEEGDDITSRLWSDVTLPAAKSMKARLTTDGFNHPITGWYLDNQDSRWRPNRANEIDVTDLSDPYRDDSLNLKAAFAGTYKVSHRFESDSEGKELPEEVISLQPVDTKEYELGNKVTPMQPTSVKVSVPDGVWEFIGYDAESKTVETLTTEFVGSWVFKPNPSPSTEPTVDTGETNTDVPSRPENGLSDNDFNWRQGSGDVIGTTNRPVTSSAPAGNEEIPGNLQGEAQALPATGESGLSFFYGSLTLVLAAVLVVLRRKLR